MVIKLNTEDIRNINLFEKITGVKVIDCIIESDAAYFVVEQGKIGLAIGKEGKNVKKVQRSINKAVHIFEYSDTLESFTENLISSKIQSFRIENSENGKRVYVTINKVDRSRVVGRGGKNIRIVKRFLKRDFDVDEVKLE